MILTRAKRPVDCTARTKWLKIGAWWLKIGAWLSLVAAAVPGAGQPAEAEPPALRQELARLIEAGELEQALRRAQSALHEAPNDARVRAEYVALHLTLARDWLAQRRFEECLTAVTAVLAVQPDHSEALAIQGQVRAAREAAGRKIPEIDRLLRLELFESALEQVQDVRALRPDLGSKLASQERAAWRGVADDHYLAGNFNEAFALYEQVLSLKPQPSQSDRRRWLISLVLALSERGFGEPSPRELTSRLAARTDEVAPGVPQTVLGPAARGLLAEQAGSLLKAGRSYAAALESIWRLPAADRRASVVAQLRRQVIERVGDLYEADRARRRDSSWSIVLAGVWKHEHTEHFDIYARNDLVAEWLAEAAEFHFTGLSQWLGRPTGGHWEPRCELRVHATPKGLQEATEAEGAPQAVTQIRLQGQRVLDRRISLLQDDPWLLSSTLPRELTHVLLADLGPEGRLPLAVEEGVALQAEPPARRLELRRILGPVAPSPTALLNADELPSDRRAFEARADALTSFLLRQAAVVSNGHAQRSPAIAMLLGAFDDRDTSAWWKQLGWDSEESMRKAWATWYDARRNPPRMPLMILAEPTGTRGLESGP
jgi:tetratricopeptide (TPR) repeat protein